MVAAALAAKATHSTSMILMPPGQNEVTLAAVRGQFGHMHVRFPIAKRSET